MKKPVKVGAILLAAGASRRLGYPKQGAVIEGESLLARSARLALEGGCDPLRVVLGFDAPRIGALLGPWLEDDRLDVCIHEGWEAGMGTSLAYGARCPWPEDLDGVLVMLCDQIHLDGAHLARLLEAFRQDPCRRVASAYEGVLGVPAIFPVQDLSALTALKGDQGARKLLREENVVACDWPEGALDLD